MLFLSFLPAPATDFSLSDDVPCTRIRRLGLLGERDRLDCIFLLLLLADSSLLSSSDISEISSSSTRVILALGFFLSVRFTCDSVLVFLLAKTLAGRPLDFLA